MAIFFAEATASSEQKVTDLQAKLKGMRGKHGKEARAEKRETRHALWAAKKTVRKENRAEKDWERENGRGRKRLPEYKDKKDELKGTDWGGEVEHREPSNYTPITKRLPAPKNGESAHGESAIYDDYDESTFNEAADYVVGCINGDYDIDVDILKESAEYVMDVIESIEE